MSKRRRMAAANPQKRKKNSRLRRYRRSILMICMALVSLSGVLAVSSVSLQAKNEEYKAQEEELAAQIKEEEKRSKEVEEFEKYVKTDDYIKDTAEEKLNLVDPNEIIFKPSE